MKHKNLALQGDAETDMAIIDNELYSILKEYDAHSRSGPRFIRINIIADISIIIKMLNIFITDGNSCVLYVYLSSDRRKRYVYSQAIQYDLGEDFSADYQIKEAANHIAGITVQMLEAYDYRTDHFSIDYNFNEDKYYPNKYFNNINIEGNTRMDKITYIVDTIIQNLNIFTDCALVVMYYHINIGDPEYESKVSYYLKIQYSEIFCTDSYSIEFKRPDNTYTEYALDVNKFTDYMYETLTYLYKVTECILDGEKGSISLYILDTISADHM